MDIYAVVYGFNRLGKRLLFGYLDILSGMDDCCYNRLISLYLVLANVWSVKRQKIVKNAHHVILEPKVTSLNDLFCLEFVWVLVCWQKKK